jgi:hypothetical protein
MTMYLVGSPYRFVLRLDKKGWPVYENTTVTAITKTNLVLANGKSIDIEPPPER